MIIAISGGIASGKNLISSIFKQYGASIFDADHEVKKIITQNKAVIQKIRYEFPLSYQNSIINSHKLREIIFNCDDYNRKIDILENIIHPVVRSSYNKFIKNNSKLNILNIPLLIESGYYKYDKLITIKCCHKIRRRRFLIRSGNDNFNNKVFDIMLSRQVSDKIRYDKYDYIVNNNNSIIYTIIDVKKIIQKLLT